jgi:7-cyano-7-deazaguanine reductase
MKQDNTKTLTKLGSKETIYQYDEPNKELLETFENQYPNRKYTTQFIFNEFTSLCPKTGQPDFAIVTVEYIPNKLCIETKSLKVYFLAYRNKGAFMETITNQILEDCIAVCQPHQMKITSNFNARGGTLINVIAEYETR